MNERLNSRRGETASTPMIVGVSSLLVVFSVLCLTVFAMLSLVTVQANRRLLQKNVSVVTGRAAADAEAQEILAALRAGERPNGVVDGMPSVSAYEAAAGSAADMDGSRSVYSYTCKISDTAHLEVSVAISGNDYEILRWTEVSDVEWENDDSINVWQEDFFGGFALPDL